jgi:hypothetical protein
MFGNRGPALTIKRCVGGKSFSAIGNIDPNKRDIMPGNA